MTSQPTIVRFSIERGYVPPPLSGQGDIMDPQAWSIGSSTLVVGSVSTPGGDGDIMDPRAWET